MDKTEHIEVIGGNVNNLKNININIPLHKFVAISGLSGSGKSSLAMGILYSEGARRYLDALATYTRRRISQVGRSDVKSVKHIPSALALRQRPTVPGARSTVGTMTEIFNVLRLMYSRLGSPKCPNGHQVPPTIEIAEAMDKTGEEMGRITCPTCGVQFYAFSAEDFAFNSDGACPECEGLGVTKQIDPDTLIGDRTKTIREGAVNAWHIPGRNFMPIVAQAAGVRIDVPFNELTDEEVDTVLHGEQKKFAINIPSKNGRVFHMDNALYENAFNAIQDSMKTTKSEIALKRLNKFYKFTTCPVCHGSRINPNRLSQLINGKNIYEASQLPLGELPKFVADLKAWLPDNMQKLADNLASELLNQLQPLLDLGLDYLTMDRAGATLSTGELQRIQLGRTLRTQTTGVLYVLDEPSVGLHPDNVAGMINIFHQLVEQGNSLVVVDHETSIIDAADWVIEIGPGSGQRGGQVITQGTPADIKQNSKSLIGPFLTGKAQLQTREVAAEPFKNGSVDLQISQRFNLNNVEAHFPINRLTAVTGFSGAGKTTLVLDGLLKAFASNKKHVQLPNYVNKFDPKHIKNVVSVDATPVGKNARSTVATYTNIMDHLRRLYAAQPLAKENHYTASHFSYNNKQGACPTCGGTGEISLDIQYLPDMVEECPTCHGKRFNQDVLQVKWHDMSIADVLDLDVNEALEKLGDEDAIVQTLNTLKGMGLDYLHLGESTPSLSGGEAQRLKLASHMKRSQKNTLFIFDEPSVGLHPIDVHVLLTVFDGLIKQGATVLMITHDLDLMANADYMIDMGPKGGSLGGKIVAAGKPSELIKTEDSLTVKYLMEQFNKYV
ncbi:excinuclease ABC subunit A [Lentilactobacillus curieae]|uniref:UvrABC system protein A n=1 Tax=Lentilactobacillus curieae TaxID=1138822 RepID=A0A1S6QHC4_9LACO|nr:excinuclease ABC subunit UvrA [Lentilactobacillus curieae]AQW21008.1 excinuclease ABC subunit A [Lentilactobacillus curieae]